MANVEKIKNNKKEAEKEEEFLEKIKEAKDKIITYKGNHDVGGEKFLPIVIDETADKYMQRCIVDPIKNDLKEGNISKEEAIKYLRELGDDAIECYDLIIAKGLHCCPVGHSYEKIQKAREILRKTIKEIKEMK